MNPTFRMLGRSELLPRYIFAESLFVHRRVLELGAVASTQGESALFLLSRGARWVVACDADLSAVEQAQKKHGRDDLRYRADVIEDLEHGGYDVIFIADLAPYVGHPEKLAEVFKRLARGGYLVGGLRNMAGLALAQLMDHEDRDPVPTYGQLLDALSPHFPSVQVATQSPLLGYQLAMEGSDGLDVDGSLVGGSEASYFVVLAGADALEAFETTWVQLPPEPLAYTAGKLDESYQRTRSMEERGHNLKDALEQTRADLAQRIAQLSETTLEVDRLREEVARLTEEAARAQRSPGDERERDTWAARLKRQEDELLEAKALLADSDAKLAAARAEVERIRRAQQESAAQALAAQELARQDRTRRQEVSAQLEETRGKLAVMQEEARASGERLAQARAEAERLKSELSLVGAAPVVSPEEREAARQRELALAEQRSLALAEAEVLRAELEKLEAKRAAAEQQRLVESQERARLERELEADRAAAKDAREALAREKAALEEALAARDAEKRGLDTELTWARTEAQRLTSESRSLSDQLQSATRMAAQLMEAQALLRHSEQEKGALRTAVEHLKAAAGSVPSEPPQGWKPSEMPQATPAVPEEAAQEAAPPSAPASVEKTEGGA
ncbi:MAG TPA: hypothetical protein VK420_00920 [Longimicrobium sp.]|nr:hypothetical protein [Longimicrobium sp.]